MDTPELTTANIRDLLTYAGGGLKTSVFILVVCQLPQQSSGGKEYAMGILDSVHTWCLGTVPEYVYRWALM